MFEADEWAAHYDVHPVNVWGAEWETAVNSDPIVESVAVPKPDESVYQVWQRRKRGVPGIQAAFPAWDGSITAEPSGRPMSSEELAEIGLDRMELQEGELELTARVVRTTPMVLREESGRTWVMDRDGSMWLVSAHLRDASGGPSVWVAGREGRFRLYSEDGTIGEVCDTDGLVDLLGEMADQQDEGSG